jgi:hypothetical protein
MTELREIVVRVRFEGGGEHVLRGDTAMLDRMVVGVVVEHCNQHLFVAGINPGATHGMLLCHPPIDYVEGDGDAEEG